MSGCHQGIVDIDVFSTGILQPDVGKVTTVFAAFVFQAADPDFTPNDLAAQKIAREQALWSLLTPHFRGVDTCEADFFTPQLDTHAQIDIHGAGITVINISDLRAVMI